MSTTPNTELETPVAKAMSTASQSSLLTSFSFENFRLSVTCHEYVTILKSFYVGGGRSEFFHVPEHLCREKAIYDDSHGASLY